MEVLVQDPVLNNTDVLCLRYQLRDDSNARSHTLNAYSSWMLDAGLIRRRPSHVSWDRDNRRITIWKFMNSAWQEHPAFATTWKATGITVLVDDMVVANKLIIISTQSTQHDR